MNKKKESTFKYGFFVYVFALVFLALAAIVYVKTLLNEYESSQPERIVEAEIEKMVSSAEEGTVWSKYDFPKIEYSEFDKNTDLPDTYAELLSKGDVTYSLKQGVHAEDGLVYNVIGDGTTLAEIALRAVGEPTTKLAVFTIQKWELISVDITADAVDYKIDAPQDFTVKVNGIILDESYVAEAKGTSIRYEVHGIHGTPDIEITDHLGNVAEYKTSGSLIRTVFYDYSLTLPATLEVIVNGENIEGEATDDGGIRYDIRMLQKPSVVIRDLYGNTVDYTGGNKLPLTYITVYATESHSITVDGSAVPSEAVTVSDNPDYEHFTEYVPGLPRLTTYDIAVLRDNADISITDQNGRVEYDKELHVLDLTVVLSDAPVPESVSAEVNVLKVAEDWSRLMSKDLAGAAYGFYNYAPNLIEGSYLYEVARKWVNSIDITFTSTHTLMNPPFSNETVRNFTWLTDNCFSVDISFDKNMLLSSGMQVTDSMNSRFHFVKYDSTNDWVDNPTWKLVNIKEIVE